MMKIFKFGRAKVEIDYYKGFAVMTVFFKGSKESAPFKVSQRQSCFKHLKGAIRLSNNRKNIPAYM